MRILLIFSVVGILWAQDTAGTGSISGSVSLASGAPAAAAEICLPALSRCVKADAAGLFKLSALRPETLELRVGIITSKVEVKAGRDTALEIRLPGTDSVQQQITVSDSLFVPADEVKTSSYLIQRAEIVSSASALQDVSRYVQTLPGVAIGSDDFRNDIIVRGGSPLENLFIVDNVEVPNINTFANFASAGGTVGILDAALIQDVTFLTGGYPAPFVNRTSSVLQIYQREGNREGFRARATLGFAGAGGILEGPIRKGKGSWVVSARRSFIDLFTKDAGFGGVPVTYTFDAKAVYDLRPADRIWAVSIAGVDNIRLGATQGGKTTDEVDNFDIRYQGWRNATGLNWQHLFGGKAVGLFGVSRSQANVDTTIKDLLKNGIPAPSTPVDQWIAGSPVVFRENSSEIESTIKYDLTAELPWLGKFQAGGSLKFFQLHYNTASPYGNDSPYLATPGVNPFNLLKDETTTQTGAYVQDTRVVSSRLSLTWGARFDNYRYLGQSRISPRAGLSFRLSSRLSFRASYGTYYQQPNFLFAAVFPQNRHLVPFRADHYVTGLSYAPSRTVRLTLEAYRKVYKDYPVATQFPAVSLANLGDTFNIRDILFPLSSAGRGRAQGIEFFVEKKFSDRFFGQANFSSSSSTQAGLDGLQRPANFDYRHVLNVTAAWQATRKWDVSARLSYLSARPYTPFDIAASQAQDRGIFDLGKVNALRFPAYFRTDLRVNRKLTLRGKPLNFYLGAQNLTNRKNIAGYTWNRRLGAIQTDKQLTLFPDFGLEWRF